jgi:hypothetical protein
MLLETSSETSDSNQSIGMGPSVTRATNLPKMGQILDWEARNRTGKRGSGGEFLLVDGRI